MRFCGAVKAANLRSTRNRLALRPKYHRALCVRITLTLRRQSDEYTFYMAVTNTASLYS